MGLGQENVWLSRLSFELHSAPTRQTTGGSLHPLHSPAIYSASTDYHEKVIRKEGIKRRLKIRNLRSRKCRRTSLSYKRYGFMFGRESARKELGDLIESLRNPNSDPVPSMPHKES
ncbi:small ubiquitin-like modifier 2 [Striga asiatica]|uniref:Small ubiquitin-like modifier 2 n=1 Tax=Striga asiatica TaxID=4170 RepID=A0A5A7R696_STRAF|nr:small ubiquitin-like modifier 2 [Striga asiatica]